MHYAAVRGIDNVTFLIRKKKELILCDAVKANSIKNRHFCYIVW